MTYARRLLADETRLWKRVLRVQAPYRRYLRRLRLGFVLDVGCGVGRNLLHLGGRGAAVGVDVDPEAVALARGRGLEAYTPEELAASPHGARGRFDSLLCAHVVEHMRFDEAAALLRRHLPSVRPGGRAVIITPQAAGFRADPTHVEAYDAPALRRLAAAVDLEPLVLESFPLPPAAGAVFRHNEWILVAATAP
jgi:SAM-dependent methyltransferase